MPERDENEGKSRVKSIAGVRELARDVSRDATFPVPQLTRDAISWRTETSR